MGERFVVLQHRSCQHIAAGPTQPQHRRLIEGQHKLLAAAGYFQWRVRTVELTDEVLAKVCVVCDTCRIDPVRGLLPGVVDAQRADPDVREAAALGAAAFAATPSEGGPTDG